MKDEAYKSGDRFKPVPGQFRLLGPCGRCAHRHITGKLPATCDAFPAGIPDVILSGQNPHTSPLPGQLNDIVFEPLTTDKK